MRIPLDTLPTDTTLLHDLAAGIQDCDSALSESQLEIDRLVLIIKQFQRATGLRTCRSPCDATVEVI